MQREHYKDETRGDYKTNAQHTLNVQWYKSKILYSLSLYLHKFKVTKQCNKKKILI